MSHNSKFWLFKPHQCDPDMLIDDNENNVGVMNETEKGELFCDKLFAQFQV